MHMDSCADRRISASSPLTSTKCTLKSVQTNTDWNAAEQMGQSRRSDRPPPTTRQHKRRNITFRVTDPIYDQLCFAADWAGRSLSEEIESRLEGSFLPGALLDRVAAGELELVVTRDRKTQP